MYCHVRRRYPIHEVYSKPADEADEDEEEEVTNVSEDVALVLFHLLVGFGALIDPPFADSGGTRDANSAAVVASFERAAGALRPLAAAERAGHSRVVDLLKRLTPQQV